MKKTKVSCENADKRIKSVIIINTCKYEHVMSEKINIAIKLMNRRG
jgi:hypothetical protein